MQDLVSVIIPCYNSSKYIEQTIQSIFDQTHTNIEILAINDGSKDNTLDILDECSKRDDRLLVVSIPNSGVSKARNIGIENSNGKYIVFVDADDTLHTTYIEFYLTKIKLKNYSLVSSHAEYMTNERTYVENIYSTEGEYNNIEKRTNLMVYSDTFPQKLNIVIWAKMYDADYIKRNKIFFDENIRTGQDFLYNLVMCLDPKASMYYFPSSLYTYNAVRGNSITSTFNEGNIDSFKRLIEESNRILQNSNISNKKQLQRSIFIGRYFALHRKVALLNKGRYSKDRRTLHKKIRRQIKPLFKGLLITNVLRDKLTLKRKIKYLVYCFVYR